MRPAPGEPVVLRVAGTLDPHTAPVLHEALTTLLCDEPEIVALDFTGSRSPRAPRPTWSPWPTRPTPGPVPPW